MADTHLPYAQVQLVCMAGRERSTCDGAFKLEGVKQSAHKIVAQEFPHMLGRVAFLANRLEVPLPSERKIAAALKAAGVSIEGVRYPGYDARRSHLSNLASQLMIQDTQIGLHRLVVDRAPAAVDPERIILMGSEENQALYEARMACRKYGVEVPGMKQFTGQLFVGGQNATIVA